MGARLQSPSAPHPPDGLVLSHRVPAEKAGDLRRLCYSAAALLLACLLAMLLRPLTVTVDGQRHVMPRRVTVAKAAELTGQSLRSGDLVDVRGLVMRPGAGRPAVVLRNGEAVSPATRLRHGDVLTIIPGQPLVEPHHEHARLLSATARGYCPAGLAGICRTIEGQWSGREVAQVVPVQATVPRAAIPRKRLALTFDDGPYPNTTAQILAVLRRHDARATFFVCGDQLPGRHDLVRREVAQGCEVGIHSWSHTAFTRLSSAALRHDLQRCDAALRPLVGQPLRYVRPPYGATNRAIAAVIRGCGYRQVLWSVDTNDWRRPGANTVAYRILAWSHDRGIVLCHDGGGPRAQTVEAIARVVPILQARGYALVTLTELFTAPPEATGGAIKLPGGQRFEAKPCVPGLAILVDDAAAELPEAPMEISDHLLLPVRPVLDLLRVKYNWDEAAGVLVLDGLGGKLTLRINSLRVETATGVAHDTPVPPVVYRGRPMVPLPLILEAAGATATYDRKTRVLKIISPAGAIRDGKVGWGGRQESLTAQSWQLHYGWGL
jgi:peptidoglycan-N-acetylglucosamine deacetylase